MSSLRCWCQMVSNGHAAAQLPASPEAARCAVSACNAMQGAIIINTFAPSDKRRKLLTITVRASAAA